MKTRSEIGPGLVFAIGLAALGGLAGVQPVHALPIGMKAPDITSPAWINAEPQPLGAPRGRVVLVEFWTFGCYNCRNVEPYVKQWHERYTDRGLVVIGIHSPEFA